MKKIFLMVLSLSLVSAVAYAEKPHGRKPITVNVDVGTEDGQLRFIPDKLTFERGKYYKLAINNPSSEDHYFTSDAFATHIFTRKVEVIDKSGKTVVEIHGAVHDIELKPGSRVEWFFFPMTKGKDLQLFCHKKQHAEQGMVGSIDIIGKL